MTTYETRTPDFSRAEYERLIELGVLGEDERRGVAVRVAVRRQRRVRRRCACHAAGAAGRDHGRLSAAALTAGA
jgi:hypothetical protein